MKKIALVGLLISLNSFSCGEDSRAEFGDPSFPDMPFNSFAAGQLGTITPHLATSYLVVAYRYFNHMPLNAAEQTAVLGAWSNYFSASPAYPQHIYSSSTTREEQCTYNNGSDDGPVNSNNLMQFITTIVNDNKAYFNWRDYRLSVLGQSTQLPIPKPGRDGQYSTYDVRSFYSTLALEEDNINNIKAGPGFNYLVLATERLHAIKEALDKQNINTSDTEKKVLSLWIKAQ